MQMQGLLEKVKYTSRNGVSEFQIIDEGTGNRMTFRGILHNQRAGIRLKIKDISEPDADGCYYYRSAAEIITSREEALVVLSGADGVSKKTAAKIVDEFGTDVMGYLDIEGFRKRLADLKGFGQNKVDSILSFLRMQTDNSEDFAWLMENGFSYQAAMSAVKEYQYDVRNKVEKDPYHFLYLNKISFETCDVIAKQAGVDIWAEERIRAVIKAMLTRIAQNGNTRMELNSFIARCVTLSLWNGGTAIPDELFSIYVYNEPMCGIQTEGENVYVAPKKYQKAESSIATDLKRIQTSVQKIMPLTEEEILEIEHTMGVTYNTEQRSAFTMLAKGGTLILTGYPGTGKTTTISGLIRAYSKRKKAAKVLLCAPTGRAASRMSEVSSQIGVTMHRAIKLTPYESNIRSTEMMEYDLIVVDEMSMCDTELFAHFLSAVPSGATILLTGDPDQLPSVGPGKVFRDLIECGRFPVCRLTQLVRQKEDSGIAKNARGALRGQELVEAEDFHITYKADDQKIADAVVAMSEQYAARPLILSPVKKGKAGIFALNRKMQEKYHKPELFITMNGTRFYVGDPIIMTHNNYKYEYYNGETGTLSGIHGNLIDLDLPGRTITLDVEDAEDVQLAYAITVHRAQGTENDHCIVVLPEDAGSMTTGELLNTAFTRAKKSVSVVTLANVLKRCQTHTHATPRECGLLHALQTIRI